jgi:hypoxanthine phosphoribosyltransferase
MRKDQRRYIYLTYDQIALKIDSMIEDIKREQFSSIVIIVRGGAFVGHHISFRTGLPVYYLRYDRTTNPATISWIGTAPPIGKVLLVEDLAGSGRTLIESRQFLEKKGYLVKALVVFKDTLSASTPEYIGFETNNPNETFIVPWEKVKFNPAFGQLSKEKPFVDHELEFTAWDLNVIFASDAPINALEQNYHSKLANPSPVLQENDVIITERPLEERERLLSWLHQHEMFYPVYMMDSGENPLSPFDIALWKGNKALEIGCTRYVERDAEQALFIASHFPHLEVIWWNNGKPISIKASYFSKNVANVMEEVF